MAGNNFVQNRPQKKFSFVIISMSHEFNISFEDPICSHLDEKFLQKVEDMVDFGTTILRSYGHRKKETELPFSPIVGSDLEDLGTRIPPTIYESSPVLSITPSLMLPSSPKEEDFPSKELQLPLLVYTRCEHKDLEGKIYGFIMGTRRAKQKDTFMIFVPLNQEQKLVKSLRAQDQETLIAWLMNEKNVPISRRYPTLSMAASQLYGKPNAVYAQKEQSEVYHNGNKEWLHYASHASIDILVKEEFTFKKIELDPKMKTFYPKRKRINKEKHESC